jgi:hypothetical protein
MAAAFGYGQGEGTPGQYGRVTIGKHMQGEIPDVTLDVRDYDTLLCISICQLCILYSIDCENFDIFLRERLASKSAFPSFCLVFRSLLLVRCNPELCSLSWETKTAC